MSQLPRIFSGAAVLALFVTAAASAPPLRPRMDLNGEWEFRTDSESGFSRSIRVPGNWQAQGVGASSGILRSDYAGTGWYRRRVTIPESWKGKRIVLRIGGALRITELLVDGKPSGRHEGMSAPFELDVTSPMRGGGEHTILLKVSNPGDLPGESPDKQRASRPTGMLNYIGNWGGIYGPVELEAMAPVWIGDLWVRSDIGKSAAKFGMRVHNAEHKAFRGEVHITSGGFRANAPVSVPAGGSSEVSVGVSMPGAALWSPDHPDLHTASIEVFGDGAVRDSLEQRFGLREITTEGNRLLLNGKPLYLRGFGDDNVEVLTGTPPASKEIYLQRLKLARSFGFNAVRFHSMTPVREYFEAADEVGILVMAELPVAYTQYLLPFKDFISRELNDLALAHRNHPSWLSLALGNEFNLRWLKDDAERREFQAAVTDLYKQAKSLMPDRPILSNDGLNLEPTDMVSAERPAPNHPTVRHEFGSYYCTLPDPGLIREFTGVMIPAWLEAKANWIETNRLNAVYPVYLRNSQKLVQLGRKFEIERARKDPGITGYEHWLIVDYPGGTGEGDSWEEGWFDYFWRPKGITPEQGREINSAVLPLIDAEPGERTLWSDTGKEVQLLVSNYGEGAIHGGKAWWKLNSDGRTVAESGLGPVDAPLGQISKAGTIGIRDMAGAEPRKLELAVSVDGHENHWDFWSFPRKALLRQANSPIATKAAWSGVSKYFPFVETGAGSPKDGGLWITPELDSTTVDFLRQGGRVWLALEKAAKTSFFPASGGALGTVIQDHAALRGFPHDDFCDLQFHALMLGAAPFSVDSLPDVTPIVSGIRTKAGFLAKTKDLGRVGYIFEAKVGKGKLLVTSLRIGSQLNDAHPEAVFLCDRLLRYCDSPDFHPEAEVGAAELAKAVAEYLR
ncbi:MAG: glycoside hydrolase family 2 TIM barrel-domain containing protein [Bryobacteraceae bacterium]